MDENWVLTEQDRAGRFIRSSNDTELDPESMLEYDKEQKAVERGFRFIKPTFRRSSPLSADLLVTHNIFDNPHPKSRR